MKRITLKQAYALLEKVHTLLVEGHDYYIPAHYMHGLTDKPDSEFMNIWCEGNGNYKTWGFTEGANQTVMISNDKMWLVDTEKSSPCQLTLLWSCNLIEKL